MSNEEVKLAIISFFTILAWRVWPDAEPSFKKCRYFAVVVLMTSVFVMIFLMVTGCSLFQYKQLPEYNAKATYKHDLVLDINGARVNGVGVAELADVYKVRVYPPGLVDRIMWRTCAKEEVIDKPDVQSSSWFNGYKYVDFIISPAFGLSDINACPLKIEVLEEKKRRNGFAYVDFKDRREEISLISDLTCNGVYSQNRGVSICQSAAGLYQQIIFPADVVQVGSNPECNVMKPLKGDEKVYRFSIAEGVCVYDFISNSKAPNGKRISHRLITVGYTDVPPIKQ